MDQSLNINPKKGHRPYPCFSFQLGMSSHVALKRADGIIPFWRAFASTKTWSQILWRQQEPFHHLQLTLDPAQGSQLNDSLVRFFSPQQRQKEDAALRAGWGPWWWDTSVLFFKKQWARQVLFNIYSAFRIRPKAWSAVSYWQRVSKLVRPQNGALPH